MPSTAMGSVSQMTTDLTSAASFITPYIGTLRFSRAAGPGFH